MFNVIAVPPAINDEPQPIFEIHRADGVLVAHFYHAEHAETACKALNQATAKAAVNTREL